MGRVQTRSTTKRIIRDKNKKVFKNMKPGDLIKMPRIKGIYSHWAVCVGGGDLVHMAPEISLEKGKVCRNKFWEVVEDSEAEINNSKDDKYSPLSVDEILANANSKIGQKGYHAFEYNCEHFANECRYGEKFSDQVNVIKQAWAKLQG